MDENQRMALALQAGFGDIGAKPYPLAAEVPYARSVDAAYGDPAAGFMNPGAAKIRTLQTDLIPMAFDGDRRLAANPNTYPVSTTDKDTSDSLMQGWLGTRRSAVAGLGFDPRHTVVSPPSDVALNVGGLYNPRQDMIWYDKQNNPSAIVHESMHRGFEQLRKNNMLPEEANKIPEEHLVRALMMKNFGQVEMPRNPVSWDLNSPRNTGLRQLDVGRQLMDSPLLDQLEQSAAQLYAKKRPGGPR